MVAVAVAVVVGAAVVGTGVVEPPETVTAPFWRVAPICVPLESASRTLLKVSAAEPFALPLNVTVAITPLPLWAVGRHLRDAEVDGPRGIACCVLSNVIAQEAAKGNLHPVGRRIGIDHLKLAGVKGQMELSPKQRCHIRDGDVDHQRLPDVHGTCCRADCDYGRSSHCRGERGAQQDHKGQDL